MGSSKNVLISCEMVALEYFLIIFYRKRRVHRRYMVTCRNLWPIPNDKYRNLFQILMHTNTMCRLTENISHYLTTFLVLKIILFSVQPSFSVPTVLFCRNHYGNRIKRSFSPLLEVRYYVFDLQTNITWLFLRFHAIDVNKVNWGTVVVEMAHMWTFKIVDLNDVL